MTEVSAPFFRTPYNYDRDAASDDSGLLCEDPSLAQQSMKDECDINNILARWVQTGELAGNPRTPSYGDFTGIGDYHTALNTVIAAQESFMALDAKLRARFHNDPGEFLDFVSNPDNLDEMRELGLAEPLKPDLSIAGSERASHAGGEPAVGKSEESVIARLRSVLASSEGGKGDA